MSQFVLLRFPAKIKNNLFLFQTGAQGCETDQCISYFSTVYAAFVNNYENFYPLPSSLATLTVYGVQPTPLVYNVPTCKIINQFIMKTNFNICLHLFLLLKIFYLVISNLLT